MQKALAFYLYDLNNFKLAKWMLFSLLAFTLGFLPEDFRFDNYSKLLRLIKLIENNKIHINWNPEWFQSNFEKRLNLQLKTRNLG